MRRQNKEGWSGKAPQRQVSCGLGLSRGVGRACGGRVPPAAGVAGRAHGDELGVGKADSGAGSARRLAGTPVPGDPSPWTLKMHVLPKFTGPGSPSAAQRTRKEDGWTRGSGRKAEEEEWSC